MFKKEEEKNKVGRPKLADSETKKKSIITLSIALVFAIALVIGGTFSLFGGVNINKLSGRVISNGGTITFSKGNYCKLSVIDIKYYGATAKWDCYGAAKVSSKAVVTMNGGKVSGIKYGGGKSGTYDFSKNMKANTRYKMDFKVRVTSSNSSASDVGTIIFTTKKNTQKTTTAKKGTCGFSVSNITNKSFRIDWSCAGNAQVYGVYASNTKNGYILKYSPKNSLRMTGSYEVSKKTVTNDIHNVWIIYNPNVKDTKSAYKESNHYKFKLTSSKTKKTSKKSGSGNKKKTTAKSGAGSSSGGSSSGGSSSSGSSSSGSSSAGSSSGVSSASGSSSAGSSSGGSSSSETSTTKKIGKCAIVVNGGKSLTYSITCKDGAKFKKGQANISNELKTIKTLKGTITPKLSSFKRGGYVTIIYNNGSKNVKINSKVVTIDNVSDYQKECLNSGIKDASATCKKYKYHIINDSTFCRAYAYKGASNTNLAIKCDSNAAPIKVELYEYDGKKYGNLVFRDTKWVRNYGFWSDKAYEQRITKYVSEKKITSGKTYAFRITYMYNDTKDTKNIVSKLDSASVVFKYGDTTLTGLDEQINKRSANDKYGTKEFQNKMTENDKCTVSASNVGKNIKYNISCGKYAYPGSLRIVTDYGSNYKPDSAYSKKLTVKHNIKYLDGKTANNVTEQENGGTIRTLFGTEAKENKASIYGMKEEGTITGVASGKTYNLVLYYGYKNPENKLFARAQIKVRSNSVTVK